MMPKLVFVGDGPAHAEIKGICEREGYDAAFMGFRYGDDLARCYASADVFTFPSFTEVRLLSQYRGRSEMNLLADLWSSRSRIYGQWTGESSWLFLGADQLTRGASPSSVWMPKALVIWSAIKRQVYCFQCGARHLGRMHCGQCSQKRSNQPLPTMLA